MATLKLRKPLTVIITLEGLSAASLGCFGCSWNETPALDSLASRGVVWDRWTATTARRNELVSEYIRQSSALLDDNRASLITDDHGLLVSDVFHKLELIEKTRSDGDRNQAVDDLSGTALGQVFAAANHSLTVETQLLWIHSAALREVWDAPREEIADAEDQAPSDEVELISVDGDELKPQELRLPETTLPPSIQRKADDHPDLVFAWMQRYASNVRMLDDLIGWASDAWRNRKPEFLVTGTSGFSLGENGWIGHGVGPIRSVDTRLPMLVSHGGPLRVGQLCSSDGFAEVLDRLVARVPILQPEFWAASPDNELAVETETERAERVTTTREWFYVRESTDPDGGAMTDERLFLKPDDLHDVNDVSRLRREVLDSFQD
ncbi:MAG: hypothetical protein AAF802_23105 [Planctomycetota bacterium]